MLKVLCVGSFFCKKPDAIDDGYFFGDDYLSVLFGSNIFDDALEA